MPPKRKIQVRFLLARFIVKQKCRLLFLRKSREKKQPAFLCIAITYRDIHDIRSDMKCLALI